MEQRSGMVEKRGMGLWLTHSFMITGVLIIFFPIWLAFVASTVTQPEIVSPPMPLLPGGHFWENYKTALLSGVNVPVATMLMNSLIIPLIASATATFLFRQFFLTIPDELAEAARVDGAQPMRFFIDIVLPMSRTNIAALFVILFIYGWNQYLWPLLITTDPEMNTIVMGIKQMFPSGDDVAEWPVIMATSILAMIPPVIVVVSMQKLFVRGLVDSEK